MYFHFDDIIYPGQSYPEAAVINAYLKLRAVRAEAEITGDDRYIAEAEADLVNANGWLSMVRDFDADRGDFAPEAEQKQFIIWSTTQCAYVSADADVATDHGFSHKYEKATRYDIETAAEIACRVAQIERSKYPVAVLDLDENIVFQTITVRDQKK